jgi:hypothetical protein
VKFFSLNYWKKLIILFILLGMLFISDYFLNLNGHNNSQKQPTIPQATTAVPTKIPTKIPIEPSHVFPTINSTSTSPSINIIQRQRREKQDRFEDD